MTTTKVAKSSNRGSKPGERRGGRQAGTPNKLTAQLKDIILTALHEAHEDGAVAYLKEQATSTPAAFMTLVGKVLPLQLTGEDGGAIKFQAIKREIVDPRLSDG